VIEGELQVNPILPITDLRTNATDYLKAVKDEPIIITRRGRACAVLVDYEQYREMIGRLETLEQKMRGTDKEDV
jgi:prevent-host-death family protein